MNLKKGRGKKNTFKRGNNNSNIGKGKTNKDRNMRPQDKWNPEDTKEYYVKVKSRTRKPSIGDLIIICGHSKIMMIVVYAITTKSIPETTRTTRKVKNGEETPSNLQ